MSIPLRFSFCTFATFALVGVYLPFLPVWLEGRGLAPDQVAVVLAVAMWLQFPIGLGMAALAERSGRRKLVIVLGDSVVLLGLIAFLLLDGYLELLLGWLLVGTLLASSIALVDNMATLPAHVGLFDYGRVRRWGSIGFIAASTLGGVYLDGRGSESVLGLLIAVAALLWISSLMLPNPRVEPRVARRLAALELSRDKTFVVFLCSVAALQSSHAALYGFATLRWLEAGIGERVIGLLWAEGVLAEVLLFTLGRRLLRRWSVPAILLLAAGAGMLRWAVLGSTTDLALLVPAQALHALTFAGTHLAAVSFISRTVDSRLSATAQGLYNGLAMGLLFGCAMLLAGWMYEWRAGSAFFAMIALSAIGGGAALLLRRRCRVG